MIVMVTGQIQLGALRSSGENTDLLSAQGFFYADWWVSSGPRQQHIIAGQTRKGWFKKAVTGSTPAAAPDFLYNLCKQRRVIRPPVRPEVATALSYRYVLPAPFQDNSFSYMVTIKKPFQSRALINMLKKANCCMERNRIHSTTKSRMNNNGGVTQVRLKKLCIGSVDRLQPITPNPLA